MSHLSPENRRLMAGKWRRVKPQASNPTTLPCHQSRGSAIPGSDAFLVFRVENPDKDAYGWIYVHFGFPFINEMPCINSSVHPRGRLPYGLYGIITI